MFYGVLTVVYRAPMRFHTTFIVALSGCLVVLQGFIVASQDFMEVYSQENKLEAFEWSWHIWG